MDSDGLIQKIALIPPLTSRYSAMNFFLDGLSQAFGRAGIEAPVLKLDQGYMNLIWQIKEMGADLTLCFNGPNPDPTLGGMPDFTGVPHLAWLLDPPYFYSSMASDPAYCIGCVDRAMVTYFEALGSESAFFLPHGVNGDVQSSVEKEYDIVLLSSVEDFRYRLSLWERDFDPKIVQLLQGMAERALTEFDVPLMQHFQDYFECDVVQLTRMECMGVSVIDLWEETRRFIRAKQRWELLDRLSPRPVHVFGIGDQSWADVLDKRMPHIIAHEGVEYKESLRIQSRSRVVLNSCPWFSTGSHDRIFSGLACGSVVVTNRNPYVQEALSGEGLVLYGRTDEDTWLVELDRHLSDPLWSTSQVEKGRQAVLSQHTWDARIPQILYECSVAKKRFID